MTAARVHHRAAVWVLALALLALLAMAAALAAGPAVASPAAAITVNSTADNATAGDGNCTLREAVNNANGDTDVTSGDCVAGNGADTIALPPGTYTLTGTVNESGNAGGDLDILGVLTINGAGASTTIIRNGIGDHEQFNDGDRVVQVHFGATVVISGVTIREGDYFSDGGGIANDGTLTLNNTVVADNYSGEDGGGIINTGVLIINNSTIWDNQVGTPSGFSAGIENFDTLTVTNSTVSGNAASESGGGIVNAAGTAWLDSVTIVSNTAVNQAGGVLNSGALYVKNSIIAGNSATSGPDCAGTLTSQGYNLIQGTAGCTITGTLTGNITGQAANLGPLADNGGGTLTHALLPGSPAIDAGNPGVCPASDQRGSRRPADGNSDGVARCDMGAFELQQLAYLPSIFKQ